jgi:ABC-type lipoprotein export system ATPase subunit
MLSVHNLSKFFLTSSGQVQAVADVSLNVAPGEFVAVQGPSGSGKTTLLLCAGGLLRPDGGQVLVEGQDLYQLSAEARARFRAASIGFVFQQFHLVPYLTVMENVLAPSLTAAVPDAADRARELIHRLGLTQRLTHVPAQLSTGERQRTALARALLTRPQLVLADEPTGNLDEASGATVLTHLVQVARDGAAVLLVTHDRRAAAQAHRIIPLAAGSASSSTSVDTVPVRSPPQEG